MFSATTIGIAFFLAMIAGAAGSVFFADKGAKSFHAIPFLLLLTAFVSSIICLIAGIEMIQGWEDPFANADSKSMGNASARGRGRGGLIILLIKFWPYALITIQGYIGWATGRMLWWMAKDEMSDSSHSRT